MRTTVFVYKDLARLASYLQSKVPMYIFFFFCIYYSSIYLYRNFIKNCADKQHTMVLQIFTVIIYLKLTNGVTFY